LGALAAYWSNPLATRTSRLTTFFLLYVSEGIPLGFTALVIATHMRRDGVDPAAIGAYVGSLYLPWAFKWAFGPIVDTITSVRFGRRRTWIVGAQLGMMLTLLVALPIDFSHAIGLFTGILLIHNVCSATQDVAIDALAVQVLPASERGAANGFMFGGQAVGQAIGGPGVLLVASSMPFKATFVLVIALLALILVMVSWRLRESAEGAPPWSIAERALAPWRRIARQVAAFVRTAARAFVSTRAAAVGVVLAVLPLGAYALALSLQSNIAVELGLTDRQIGTLGLYSSLMSAAGCIAGGWLSDRFGRRRILALAIFLTAIPGVLLAMTLQHAGLVAPGQAGNAAAVVPTFWMLCIAFNFVQGLMYGSSSALYMDITTPAVAATQFTAYMALGNLVTSYTALWQGFAIVHYGYPATLALDAAFGLISLLVLASFGANRSGAT
jgi:PAT family beta-lactamase induction signal transducer AmpG